MKILLQNTTKKLWRDVWMYICLLFLISMLRYPDFLSVAAAIIVGMACLCKLFAPLAPEHAQQ